MSTRFASSTQTELPKLYLLHFMVKQSTHTISPLLLLWQSIEPIRNYK